MTSDGHTIPEHIAERVARLVNAAEDMRQQAADDLKQIYADLREELRGMGWNGAAASAEIAGFKGAIVELRLDEQAKAKREAKGDRIDVYADMLRLAGARARVREGRSYADAKLVETVVKGVRTEIGRTALIAAIDAMLAVDETTDPETGEIIETQESDPANERSSDDVIASGAGVLARAASASAEHASDESSRTDPHSTVAAPAAAVEQPEAPNSSPATSGANSAPVIGHVNFATSGHINPDDMPEIPAFLRRDFERAEA